MNIFNSFANIESKRVNLKSREWKRHHSESFQQMFVEGFKGQSDYMVKKWWNSVKNVPAPRCSISNEKGC